MLHKLKLLYYRFFKSGVEYARLLGIKVGEHCHIAKDVHFSSEPYLIEIGSYIAVTQRVMIHTHGGGVESCAGISPILMSSGELQSVTTHTLAVVHN